MPSIALVLAVLLSFPAAAASIPLTDDLGRRVTLNAPAQRIVTLAPFLTELVFAAGAGERVVGVSAFSDYPPEAKQLPPVSSAAGVSLEQLAALRPDLVIAWRDSFRVEDIDRITRFGATVFVAQGRRLDDVPRLLRVLVTATGRDVTGVVARFEADLAALRARYAGKPKVDVFLEIWHKPLTTISGGHFMNDALDICGARNVFADHVGVAPQVSWEELFRRDPPVIIGTGSASSEREFRENWGQRATLGAVKAGRLAWLDPDRIQRPTTRTPQGVAQLCEKIDRFR